VAKEEVNMGAPCLSPAGPRIGLAIARRLAADGDSVTVTSRSGEPVQDLAVVRCDVAGRRFCRCGVRRHRSGAGAVEVLVATGVTVNQLLALMSEDDFCAVLDTN